MNSKNMHHGLFISLKYWQLECVEGQIKLVQKTPHLICKDILSFECKSNTIKIKIGQLIDGFISLKEAV